MKILLVNKFNFLRGGSDKYFLDVADVLGKKSGVEVAKFCMTHPDNLPDPYSRYWVSEVNYSSRCWRQKARAAARALWSFEAARKFELLIKDFKPDVIHLHNIYHQISPSILPIAKKYNIPVLMHIHDYKLVCPNYKMFTDGQIDESCRGGAYWHCLTKRCLKGSLAMSALATLEMYLHHKILKVYEKNIDLYLSPSEFTRRKLIEWGMPAEKIKTFYHYVDTGKYRPNFALGDYALFFGRLEPEKGVDTLLKAMSLSHAPKLKIIGSGSDHKRLKAMTLKLNLGKRVEFLGPKHGDELVKLVADSFLVVVPSRYYEVFGLVTLEAAALGKLVLAADCGGLAEAVNNHRTGLLFRYNSAEDLATKLDWCFENPKQTVEMAKQGRRAAEANFSRDQHFKKLMVIYQEAKKYGKKI